MLLPSLLSTSRPEATRAADSTLACDREMRKTFEALQAWRRTHGGAYPARLSDLKAAALMPQEGAVCPEVLREAAGAASAHQLATSRVSGGDPSGSYEYELSRKVPKSEFDARWLPADCPPYTRQDLKLELLRRPFHEQVPILRCNSHRAAAPPAFTKDKSSWRNCTDEGGVYWSGEYWEQRWLSDVPYCCRDANVLFGLKGPPFHTDRSPTLKTALDLRPWACAFGDHPWWWNYPMFDESPNSQKAPQLRPFFEERHGRKIDLAGTEWWVDGLAQLQGRILTDPKNVYREPGILAFVYERNGLRVERRFAKAMWLQATVWTARPGETVGSLVWHYADGKVERVPLVYGLSTARFWGDLSQIKDEDGFPEPVWKYEESARAVGRQRWLRLYRQTWTNPRPEDTVESLDFVSNPQSPAAPFIIAVNVLP